MAGGCGDLDLESQHSDTSPLLMDQPSFVNHEHVVNIRSASNPPVPSSNVETGGLYRSLSSPSVPQQEGVPAGS